MNINAQTQHKLINYALIAFVTLTLSPALSIAQSVKVDLAAASWVSQHGADIGADGSNMAVA
jgi:acetyl esterase/lipase